MISAELALIVIQQIYSWIYDRRGRGLNERPNIQLQLAEWSHSPNEQTRARAHAAATPWLSSQAAR